MTQRLAIRRGELVAVASALGLADDPAAPPRALWERIVGQVLADGRKRPPPIENQPVWSSLVQSSPEQ